MNMQVCERDLIYGRLSFYSLMFLFIHDRILDRIPREVLLLTQLSHVNIVKIIEVCLCFLS